MANLINFPCFSSTPFITKSTPDSRVKTSSEQASADAARADAQERLLTALPRKKIRFGDYKINIDIPGTANRKPVIAFIPLGGTISAVGTEHQPFQGV